MEKLLTIIIPCYNEEDSIEYFFNETEKIDLPIQREYLFIDDGSKDHSLKKMKKLYQSHPDKVRYLSFSRNFGKEAGIYGGLREAQGDYVVLMDVDMQDPPSLLPEMYRILTKEDYDCVGTRRINRKGEPPVRSFFAGVFYKLMNRISEIEIVDGARDFRMMTRQMVDAILEITEYNRFSKGIFAWVGFNTYYLEYENIERKHGETAWSFWSLFKYSIEGIISFTEAPLDIASFIGFFTFILALLLAAVFFIRTLIFDNPTEGWTSLIVVVLALGGLQLLSLGVLGKYLGKMFLEIKNRPVYIVKETEEQMMEEDEPGQEKNE